MSAPVAAPGGMPSAERLARAWAEVVRAQSGLIGVLSGMLADRGPAIGGWVPMPETRQQVTTLAASSDSVSPDLMAVAVPDVIVTPEVPTNHTGGGMADPIAPGRRYRVRTEARRELLIRLRAQENPRLTGTQIAAELSKLPGGVVTRSALDGWVYNLGLPRRRNTVPESSFRGQPRPRISDRRVEAVPVSRPSADIEAPASAVALPDEAEVAGDDTVPFWPDRPGITSIAPEPAVVDPLPSWPEPPPVSTAGRDAAEARLIARLGPAPTEPAHGPSRPVVPPGSVQADDSYIRAWAAQRGLPQDGALNLAAINRKRADLGQQPFADPAIARRVA